MGSSPPKPMGVTPLRVANTPANAGGDERKELGTAMTVPPPSAGELVLTPGTMVSDRYRIVSLLGEGGMGAVYSAEHVHMRKQVAVKVLHAEMCSHEEVTKRFENEAIAAAHIEHPNVAAATDFGRLPNGSCFLVLEYLRGRSLRDEIAKGPIEVDRALRILRGIAAGVGAAHNKQIIHRDLKPENVMLIERGGDPDFPKVLDFGIAKIDPSAPQATGKAITRVGAVFGTPEYMAPEQAVGDTVDARADLFALGVIFIEMLAGKCPFEGKPLDILRERILAEGPPDLSGVAHVGARELIGKLVVRKPEGRLQSAAELVAAIDAQLASTRASAPTAPPSDALAIPRAADDAKTIKSPEPRPPWMLPVAIGAIAMVVGILITVIAMSGSSKAEPAPITSASATQTAPIAPAPPPVAPSASAALIDDLPATPPPEPTTSAASARAKPKAKPAGSPKKTTPKKNNGINIDLGKWIP